MRDNRLDYLKAVGCFLMVLAHSAVGKADPIMQWVVLLGSLAPVYFFSVAGITAVMRAEKYALSHTLMLYISLCIFGLSFNGMAQGNFYLDFQMEILQIIAIGSLLTFLIHYFGILEHRYIYMVLL